MNAIHDKKNNIMTSKKNTSKSSTGLKKEKIGGKIDKKQVLAGSLY